MLPEARDASYLLDMIAHARGVMRAVQKHTFEDYQKDEDLRLLVERRVEIIGEAAHSVSEAFQETHPQIPWRKIVGQRNILVHKYGDIDDEIMWDLVTISIPELIRLLEPIIPA
jgi:uncharacterized protein with HEPN domain